jgi:hypothetical protein
VVDGSGESVAGGVVGTGVVGTGVVGAGAVGSGRSGVGVGEAVLVGAEVVGAVVVGAGGRPVPVVTATVGTDATVAGRDRVTRAAAWPVAAPTEVGASSLAGAVGTGLSGISVSDTTGAGSGGTMGMAMPDFQVDVITSSPSPSARLRARPTPALATMTAAAIRKVARRTGSSRRCEATTWPPDLLKRARGDQRTV